MSIVNDRIITDHAEHCDFYVGNEHYDKSYEEQQRLWVEKFAELIIQECLTQVDKMSDEFKKDGEDQQELGARWVGLAIERHFGVK